MRRPLRLCVYAHLLRRKTIPRLIQFILSMMRLPPLDRGLGQGYGWIMGPVTLQPPTESLGVSRLTGRPIYGHDLIDH